MIWNTSISRRTLSLFKSFEKDNFIEYQRLNQNIAKGTTDPRVEFILSSPRAKRTGPKGLRAESAKAFTGRRNSYSGRGEDFLSRQPIFFTETAVTPERKVEKWFPRWEINRHAEG